MQRMGKSGASSPKPKKMPQSKPPMAATPGPVSGVMKKQPGASLLKTSRGVFGMK
jgi:hypothetical protein